MPTIKILPHAEYCPEGATISATPGCDAWAITTVDEERWKGIRAALRQEVIRWKEALNAPREVMVIEISGMVGSVVHTAYHLGAIRQIVAGARGPKDPMSG